jgi:hypothetical protein
MKNLKIWMILFLPCILSACSRGEYDLDCSDHGEVVEGDCICDQEWGGIYCEQRWEDAYRGGYGFDAYSCDSTAIPWTVISVSFPPPPTRTAYIQSPHLIVPITCTYNPDPKYALDILPQENALLDTAGQESPIHLEGIANFYGGTIQLRLVGSPCLLKFDRR